MTQHWAGPELKRSLNSDRPYLILKRITLFRTAWPIS